jgi:uncharacterized protein (DUF305 family)
MKLAATLIPAAILAGSMALAQSEGTAEPAEGMDHGAMDHGAMEGMDHGEMAMSADPALQALMAPMDAMMAMMPTSSSGDVDADFLLMMIPHHQSAIDMAEVVLEQGDDEETRAMAQAIIDAQEAEIAEMRGMLERLGVEPPAE